MDPVSISIIGVLLSIIGYLIVEGRIAQRETNKRLLDLIKQNTEVIASLDKTIEIVSTNHNNLVKGYEEHKIICGYPRTKTNSKVSS